MFTIAGRRPISAGPAAVLRRPSEPGHALRLGGLLCLLILGVHAPIGAQEASGGPAPEAIAAGGEQTPIGELDPVPAAGGNVALVSAWDFVRMFLVLGAVIAAIYVVFLLIRRSGRRTAVENDLITVLGSKGLVGNRSLHLVRVGRNVYLVGSSENGVGLVSEISDKESVDEITLAAAKQATQGRKTFSDILGGLFPQPGGGLALPDGLGFLRRQRERLRKVGSP
jgi:flagellar biogenesis protein FliO